MIDRIISTVTENMNNNLWDTENRWSELYPPPNLHVCIRRTLFTSCAGSKYRRIDINISKRTMSSLKNRFLHCFLDDNIVALLAKNAMKSEFNEFAETRRHAYTIEHESTSQSKRSYDNPSSLTTWVRFTLRTHVTYTKLSLKVLPKVRVFRFPPVLTGLVGISPVAPNCNWLLTDSSAIAVLRDKTRVTRWLP
jgi:hypothetical protein